jgi:tetratricopeptide (TPR) repeat protein
LLYDIVEAHHAAGQHAEALAVCEELVAVDKNSADAHVVLGCCQLELKSVKEAKDSFQLALAINPANAEAQEGLKVASALLGQGDNSAVKAPIEPVAIPAEIAERLAALPPLAHSADEYGAYEFYGIKGYWFVPGQPRKRTVYRKIKILGPEGISRYKLLTLQFDPLVERAFVNRLAVFDAEGRLAAEGKVDDYYDVDCPRPIAARRVHAGVRGHDRDDRASRRLWV